MSDLNESSGLRLSAVEIKALTDWPDSLVEDYLSMSRLIVEATQIINVSTQEIPAVEAALSHLRGVFDNISKEIKALEEEVASFPRVPLPSNHHKKRIDSHEQQLAADESLMALDRASLSKFERENINFVAARIFAGL